MSYNTISNTTLGPKQTQQLSPLKRAVLALEDLKCRVVSLEQDRIEPIAIVGVGCQFPGQVNDLSSFQQLLHNGVDAIGDIPASRWDWSSCYDPNPENPDTAYVKSCGFIADVDQFDADFFRISPREAVTMDPQQRLLLEICWQALEQGGIAPDRLKNTTSGVFVGINTSDYARMQSDVSTYEFTGNTFSVAAGRLAYILGLQGPALAIDTACSSSLVSVHLACQSLRTHECDLALAGGVNLILSPQTNIMLSRMRALAPDGRCKTFDAMADGYGRGEGCGMVVLKRLSDAHRDRNQILAVVRGSAVNHDGNTSGLTVPNGLAQQKLLHAALVNARVNPHQIGYVEAHGTGTSLGDPIELEALNQVLCQGRSPQNPLTIASVKTNIGHLEAAAGIAGLIKAMVTLRTAEFSPHLHLKTPNPLVDWANMPVVIPTEPTPWQPEPEQPRLAGVSSFGMSGTNAHLILQEWPSQASPQTQPDQASSGPHLLILSAKNETALNVMVQEWMTYLHQNATLPWADVCYTAAVGRSALPERLAVFAQTSVEACEKLQHWLNNSESESVLRATVNHTQEPKVGFIVPEQQEITVSDAAIDAPTDELDALWEHSPYSQSRDRCYQLYQQLRLEMDKESASSPLSQDTIPSLIRQFADQYAQAQCWLAWGVEPKMFLGQGVGEYVVACLSGIFPLEVALRLLLAQTIWADAVAQEKVEPEKVEPEKVEPEKVEQASNLESAWEKWQSFAISLAYRVPNVGIISHTTGNWATATELTQPAYWCSKIPPLTNLEQGQKTLDKRGCDISITLQPGQQDPKQCFHWLAQLYLQGVDINWEQVYGSPAYHRISLPTYPFQRSRYWVETPMDVAPQTQEQDWCYHIEWQTQDHVDQSETIASNQSQPFSPSPSPEQRGKWLILADQRYGIGQTLADQLARQGEPSLIVFAGERENFERPPEIYPDCQYLYFDQPEQFKQQLVHVLEPVLAQGCCGVIHLWSLDAAPVSATTSETLKRDQFRSCGTVLHLVQTLAQQQGAPLTPRLYLISQNAQPVYLDSGSPPLALAQSSLWGLGRSIALEHPELRSKLIDLPSIDLNVSSAAKLAIVADLAAQLLRELKNTDLENQVVLGRNQRYLARLVPTSEIQSQDQFQDQNQARQSLSIREDGAYLITGGLGALGLCTAKWLADRGAKHIVLVGRSAPKQASLEAIATLQQSGANVMTQQADIADAQQVERLFQDLEHNPTLPSLMGIFHLAGVLEDGVLLRQNWQRFNDVLAPKVLGGWNLHQQSQTLPLDFFVSFSSIASVLGSPGQGNYAAANAFLDTLAHERQRQGLTSFSLNWSPWAESGMAAELGDLGEQRWKALGIDLITPDQGLALLDQMLNLNQAPQTTVLPITTWSQFIDRFAVGTGLILLADIVKASTGHNDSDDATMASNTSQSQILQQLAGLSLEDAQAEMVCYLQQTTATLLGRDASQLPQPHQGFFDMGMDSLMALEFRNALQGSLGSALSTGLLATLIFDYPTIDILAAYLISQVLPDLTPDLAPVPETETSFNLDQTIDDIQQLSESDLIALFDRELNALGIQK
ncbi:MAG: type I polyketide synthase [Cyanothece sp. SIO2G6]|nr:type I polyketide synthase [Cyanothece sp. SIO2G6]